jgi:hypothetical protein
VIVTVMMRRGLVRVCNSDDEEEEEKGLSA